MSRCRVDDRILPKGKEFELAEAVAGGLHSLAQPLAALQLGLEMCLAVPGDPEHQRQRVEQALLETERIYHRLSSVRETVLPYRRRPTQLETRSLREALEQACSQRAQVLMRDAMEVCFDPQCSPAEVTASPDVISKLALAIVGYLHCVGSGVAHLVLSEWDRRIRLDVACTQRPFSRNTSATQLLALIQAHVFALEGEVEVSEAAALLRVELWKDSETTAVPAA